MTLASGQRLGPYEIQSALGSGGMGEVYRARDTRLGRVVAVKVLRAALGDPEARHRILREARAIATFNHPHICTLHDVGSHEGIDYLVMEHLEGETLAARLERGTLPAAEALRIAVQVLAALEAAHRRSLTHHDLKPANIMLTRTGAKLLDFGIARIRPSGPTSSEAPTRTRPDDGEEQILCTLAYASPEVISGKPADSRSDLWAFGATLYEMTSGRRAFDRGSGRATVAAILELEPPPLIDAPPGLERVIRQCLAKDPEERWQTAGDLRREVEWIARSQSKSAPVIPHWRPWHWIAAVLVVAALSAGLATLMRSRPPPATVRSRIPGPPQGSMSSIASDIALSPDGRAVAFVGADRVGHNGLWVRRLSESDPVQIPGTTGAIYPFWSPDSRQVAFFADGKLKRVPAVGGQVTTLADAPDSRGGSWGSRGVLIFSPRLNSILLQVSADGGTARPALLANPSEQGNQRFPCFLPDGRHFLYSNGSNVAVGKLDSRDRVFLMPSNRAAVYAAPGYVLFGRDGSLFGQRFDPARLRLEGAAVRVEEIDPGSRNTGDQAVAVSTTGLLAYPTGGSDRLELFWADEAGKDHGALRLPPATLVGYRLSPDGRKIVVTAGSLAHGNSVWIYDVASGTGERLTFGPERNRTPIWSPDSKRILYESNRGGDTGMYLRDAVAGAADTLVFSSKTWMEPFGWSSSGVVVLGRVHPVTGYDIWLMPIDGNRVPVPYLQTPASEKVPTISSDGKWLAYESNETGRFEIYIQSFPRPGTKYQVSVMGGRAPEWSRNGRELYYFDITTGVMMVSVEGNEALRIGTPVPRPGNRADSNTLISRDGLRFLRQRTVESGDAVSLTMVQNWTTALRP